MAVVAGQHVAAVAEAGHGEDNNVKIGVTTGLNVGHRQQASTWSTAVTRLYTFTTFLLLSFPCLYSLFLHCDDDENNF